MISLKCVVEDLQEKDHKFIKRLAEHLSTNDENQVVQLADELTKDQLIGMIVYLAGRAINWSVEPDQDKLEEMAFCEVALANEIDYQSGAC